MKPPTSDIPSVITKVELRFAFFVSDSSDDSTLLDSLFQWQQTHPDEIEWIPAVLRPDLQALCGVNATPCFAAFLSDGRPVFAELISTLDQVIERYDALYRTMHEQPLVILELAKTVSERKLTPFHSEKEPPELSTMLVQEWVHRIETHWNPSGFSSEQDMRVVETLVRFRERTPVSQLLEVCTETVLAVEPERLTTLYLARHLSAAISLYAFQISSGKEKSVASGELFDKVLKFAATISGRYNPQIGLFRIVREQNSNKGSENQIFTTVTEQCEVIRALIKTGWIAGSEWWNIAGERLSSMARLAGFAADGCRLALASGNERGTMLCDGIAFSEVALDYYDATGNTRWLTLGETVSAIWLQRFQSQELEWLDWFARGHSLQGQAPAPFEQGLIANNSLRFARISGNEQWTSVGERFLANSGRYVLEYPHESVSLIEGIIRLFGRDLTLNGPWEIHGLPAEWRFALFGWLPDLRVEWRSSTPVPTLRVGSHVVEVAKPLDFIRILLEKRRRKT